jgi:ATP-dependent HslUV protease ATP-binding subunit HslU
MEKVMEEISFEASEIDNGQVKIDREYVLKKVEGIAKDSDLSKYIL